ncbi:MAG: SocA family protein [Desulfovibrio sp.]|jgi:hypothetical protein|nr:SocA family protein [Desulfovibrio sp.]
MNIQKIDAVLAQVLVSADRLEDYQDRELGPIHFIKYLYLADLFFAEKHNGRTFTGIHWRFHHFGPWDTDLYQHLDSALAALGAVKKTATSQYGHEDYIRWSLRNSDAANSAAGLDVEMVFFLDRQVKRFANKTPELLDFVYKTPPMLRAAPGEVLSFEPSGFSFREADVFTQAKPIERTEKQKKKIREWERSARAHLAEKFKELSGKKQETKAVTLPLYDEVFFQAMSAMEASDLSEVAPGRHTARIDDSVWKSKARSDDVP